MYTFIVWVAPGGNRTPDPGGVTAMLYQLSQDHPDLFCREIRLVVMLLLREHDGEHSVRPAACLVHVGRSHSPAEW